MDFDEFAMWIMNSEFQPKEKVEYHGPTQEQELATKFRRCVNAHPMTFDLLKRRLTFMELCSMMTNKVTTCTYKRTCKAAVHNAPSTPPRVPGLASSLHP